MKTASKAFLVLLISLILSNHVFSAQPVTVLVEDKPLAFDVPPVMQKGRILVPVRGIFEAMGAAVEWDEERKTVLATKDGIWVKLILNEKTAYVNNGSVKLDVPPALVNGRVMIPLRFVGDVFGAEVDWNSKTSTVRIYYKPPLDYKNIKVEEIAAFNEDNRISDFWRLPDGNFLIACTEKVYNQTYVRNFQLAYPFLTPTEIHNFIKDNYGQTKLYHYDLQAKKTEEIASFDYKEGEKNTVFNLLPDGRVLARCIKRTGTATSQIASVFYLINTGTKEVRELFNHQFDLERNYLSNRGDILYDIPDLKKNQTDYYKINLQGEVARLTYSPDVIEAWPSWSPDGNNIAYLSYPKYGRPKPNPYISVMKADGSRTTKFNFPANLVSEFDWSPDSQFLAYHVPYTEPPHQVLPIKNDYGIWTIKADGTLRKRILATKDPVLSMVWSPDGSKLAADIHDDGFMVLNRDGTGVQRFDDFFRAWSPDGKLLLYSGYGRLQLYDLTGDKVSVVFSDYVDKIIWPETNKIYVLSGHKIWQVSVE